jgi:hypothetical protein
MLLRRISEHVRAQHWTAVGIDFLIVVLGVFVGVQVDSWWDARSNARKERAYLLELKEDFAQVINELEGDSREYAMIAVAMVTLLEESHRDAPTLPVAELNRNVGRLIYMVVRRSLPIPIRISPAPESSHSSAARRSRMHWRHSMRGRNSSSSYRTPMSCSW